MKRPNPPGAPINARRYRTWTSRFATYRDVVTNQTIESWIAQFDKVDKDLAARVLDVVEFIGQSKIHACYREALEALRGWNRDPSLREGKWRFVAMSGSAGESGDAMLHAFRLANHLDTRAFDDCFISRSELFRQPLLPDGDPRKLGPDDTVVLVDDFSGTGEQVITAWNDPATSFGALLAGVGRIYLLLIAVSKDARKRIVNGTDLGLVASMELDAADNIFSNECTYFSQQEKSTLSRYGRRASRRNPRGRGGCGFVIVFQHRTPNNTIPVLHAESSSWLGLFPRHDATDED